MIRRAFLLAFVALLLALSISASAIIIEPEKAEYRLGEMIELKVYTTGNATVQLLFNGSVVWEKRLNESGILSIPTSSLPEGDYTIYASDDRGEVVEVIRLERISARATFEIKSRIEGNLTVCGETNLSDGRELLVEVDGVGKVVRVSDSHYCAYFDVGEGVYNVKVIFEGETLNETKVYVEGFKIRSVRFQPELFVGETLVINVSANLKGFELKIAIYNNKTEEKLSSYTYSNSGEITFDAWLSPADYSVMILVIHGNSTDIMKLPLKIKESFLSARVESFSDGKAVISAKAPMNHVLWFVAGTKVKKAVVGEERRVAVLIETSGDEMHDVDEVVVIDQLNHSENRIAEMLNTGKIEVPFVRLYLNQSLKLEKTAEDVKGDVKKEGEEETGKNVTGINVNQAWPSFEGVNLVAALLTILIVGGILAALVVMIRG